MNYFEYFPITDYSFDNKNYFYIRDFTKRVVVDDFLTSTAFTYFEYTIKDNERPEDVAYKQYGSSSLHWIILLINNIVDPISDWCLSTEQVYLIAKEKYDNVYATHHYFDSTGVKYGANEANLPAMDAMVAVSNLDYEISLNEEKRHIKLLQPSLVSNFVTQFAKVIAQ